MPQRIEELRPTHTVRRATAEADLAPPVRRGRWVLLGAGVVMLLVVALIVMLQHAPATPAPSQVTTPSGSAQPQP